MSYSVILNITENNPAWNFFSHFCEHLDCGDDYMKCSSLNLTHPIYLEAVVKTQKTGRELRLSVPHSLVSNPTIVKMTIGFDVSSS